MTAIESAALRMDHLAASFEWHGEAHNAEAARTLAYGYRNGLAVPPPLVGVRDEH